MDEYYCHRESWGFNTNLQLCSLLQAWRIWKELESRHGGLSTNREREQCVVVIDLLGLSLSQLLGQNVPGKKEELPAPADLLDMVLNNLPLERSRKNAIKHKFKEFIKDYDACRHFGLPKYETVAKITFEQTGKYVELTLLIWDTVCRNANTDFDSTVGLLEKLCGDCLEYDALRELTGNEQ